jgi:hypothetical protein
MPYTHGDAHGTSDNKPPSPIFALSGEGMGRGDSSTVTCVEFSVSGAVHETKSMSNNIETAIFLTMIRSPISKSGFDVLLYGGTLFTVFTVLPFIFRYDQG